MLNNIKEKFLKVQDKINTSVVTYTHTNVLFISYVLVCLFNSTLIRYYTLILSKVKSATLRQLKELTLPFSVQMAPGPRFTL